MRMAAKDYLTVARPAPLAVIVIDIPKPVSVNAMYANIPGKGRIKSAAYRAWIIEAGWRVKAQRPASVTGPYNIEVQLPADMRGDVDGPIKAAVDLMVKLGITPDDRHAQRVTAIRVRDLTEARILISEATA